MGGMSRILRAFRTQNDPARRSERGMAMVEMVIILPLLLMLMFAIVEFAVAFGQWQVLSNAAREGARRAILYRDPASCDPAVVATEVRQAIKTYALGMGMTVTDPMISVSGTCSRGDPATVTVSFPFAFQVLPNMANDVSSGFSIVGSSVMRNE